jgi:N-terminal domain of galactosyltransferase
MSGKPGLSVLIPWYERDELRLTLAANAPFFHSQRADVLVLNCGGDRGRLRDLIAASEAAGVRQLDISAPKFNKSRALNIGISQAKFDHLLTLDADIVLLDDSLALALGSLDELSFVTIEWVHESRYPASAGNPLSVAGSLGARLVNTTTLEFTFPDGDTIHYQASRRNPFRNMRAGPGILLAKKQDLLKVQGYNSNLETWGWEDDDILLRLQYVLKQRRIQTGAALHLTHGDDRRTLQGRFSRSDQLNFLKCCRAYNNGQFLGTYESDVAWAVGRVAEPILDGPRPEPRMVPLSNRDHAWSIPEDCGDKDPMPCQNARDWETRPPSLDELLLEASLKKWSLGNCVVLLVGSANSRLASRLSPLCRHITGVSADERDLARCVGLGLPNYQAVVCNQYRGEFGTQLPRDAYDIIVDSNLASEVCCRIHWERTIENYVGLLGPHASILTSQEGRNFSSTCGCALSEDELAYLAAQRGLCVSKTPYGVYALRRA